MDNVKIEALFHVSGKIYQSKIYKMIRPHEGDIIELATDVALVARRTKIQPNSDYLIIEAETI